MEAFRLLQENSRALSLISVGVKEVIAQGVSPAAIFALENGRFNQIFAKGEVITKEKVQRILLESISYLYISKRDYPALKEGIEDLLRRCGRSISMGSSGANAKRMLNLIAIHLSMVFREPTHDATLSLHYQSIRALAIYLIDNKKIIPELYFSIEKMNHFYAYSQPLLSSLMFLGLLGFTQIFNPREMEVLFIASYFKDLGMALVPEELLGRSELAPQEKIVVAGHGTGSAKILHGRVPLAQNYLNMIERHHIHSLLDKDIKLHGNDSIMGIETLFMSMTDMLTAMGAHRPYREKMDLFASLSYLKNLVVSDYPQEFKALVQYVQKLYQDQAIANSKKAA